MEHCHRALSGFFIPCARYYLIWRLYANIYILNYQYAPAVKPLQEQIYSGLGLHPQEMSPSLMPSIEFIWTKDGMKSSEQDPIHI